MSCAPRNTKINRTDRLYLQSDAYTGFGVNSIRTNFLTAAARGFRAPVIDHFLVKFTAVIDTGTDGADMRDFFDLVRNVYIRDATGERINCSGMTMWLIDRMENGNAGRLQSTDNAGAIAAVGQIEDVAASQSNQSVTFYLNIPFRPRKCRSRGDFGFPLRELCDVGEFNIDIRSSDFLGAQRITSLDSISFRVYAEVYEDRNPELKSRIVYKEWNLSQSEYWYPVNGALRWAGAFLHRKSIYSASLPTSWATGTLSSHGLEIYETPADVMILHALGEHSQYQGFLAGEGTGGASWFEDPLSNGWFVPVYYPREDEKLTILPQVESVHFKTTCDVAALVAASKTPLFVASFVTTRSPSAGALTLGTSSPAAAIAATDGGTVVAADGKRLPLNEWAPTLVARMPVKPTAESTMSPSGIRQSLAGYSPNY